MSERSDRPAAPLRLVLDFGETVELDGSTVYDPLADAPAPAVVLRMPAHRAAWFGHVLSTYTRMCELAGSLPAAESDPAWALARAAAAAGHVDPTVPELRRVTSAQRARAMAVLDDADGLNLGVGGSIAVVDAAARWLEEPYGSDYAWALLGAVADEDTQRRAYGALVGSGGVR